MYLALHYMYINACQRLFYEVDEDKVKVSHKDRDVPYLPQQHWEKPILLFVVSVVSGSIVSSGKSSIGLATTVLVKIGSLFSSFSPSKPTIAPAARVSAYNN